MRIKDEIEKDDIFNVLLLSKVAINKWDKGDKRFVDYLGAHPKNKEFRHKNGLNMSDIIMLAKDVEVEDFCHIDIDSLDGQNLYCFKLKLILDGENTEDVLYKFKIRNGIVLSIYIMSFHYPDDINKEPWTYIWREN